MGGVTLDISHLRFKWWDQVWYLEPNQKYPERKMLPGRFLGFVQNVGDALNFYVLTEPSRNKRQTVIARSVVSPRLPGEMTYRSISHKPSDYYFPSYTGQSQPSDTSLLDTDQDLKGNGNTATLNPRPSNKRKRSEETIQLENNEIERIRQRERRAESQPTTINTGRHTTNTNNHESSDEDSTSDDEPIIQV